MSDATIWEPVNFIALADGLEIHVDEIAMTIGKGCTALATHAWPEDGNTYALCRQVPAPVGASVPSGVWVVYRTDGYHPSNVAYFASEDEAKKCAEWSRAEEVRKYQEIDVAEFYADDYGVYSMPFNTTFATWLAQQQRGQG